MERRVHENSEFTEKFARKIRLCSEQGTYAVDIAPERVSDTVPITFVTGWCTSPISYRNAHEAIYSNNRRAISISYPKRELEGVDHDVLPKIHFQKARLLYAAVEQLGVESTDVVAHSQGALTGAIFAYEHPEKVRNIVFDSPGGLVPPSSTIDIMKRYTQKVGRSITEITTNIVQSEKSLPDVATIFEAVKAFGSNPVYAMREAGEIARSDMVDILRSLKQRGIGIGIIASANDPLFPYDEIDNFVTTDAYHLMHKVTGPHNGLNINAATHTQLVLETFHALEQLRFSVC